ncbi:FAD-dependent oxidoreductase [Bradyrhizobium sp. STM 3561]|uniref:FAD-dependent oxidoreductase n=1 Tax=Bradyrhizobium sp. STM 3561 TaxID=578923 RepID=UPI00388F9597
MLKTYKFPKFEYRPSPEQQRGVPARHTVVVVGAGPVGLTAALELAARGIPAVVLDDNDTVSIGSRALAYAKRSLEVWDRLGCADRLIEKGVSWKVGKVFFRNELRYQFDLLPETDHKMPAMINLQQYYLEESLIEEISRKPLVDLRWKHKVVGLRQAHDHVILSVETPDGVFTTTAEWVLACDGANSDVRAMVGATFSGQAFQDRFLIADVVMKAEFPPERWFWFDPPFHRNQSALLHRQASDVWRIDFQLGRDADPDEERKPERVVPRIRAMLGDEHDFELEWVSIYQFACRRIDDFRYGRVLFAGDCAHQVSPFGGRGANTGVQDIDNLGWKLKLIIDGDAPISLIDSYNEERGVAADDNLLNSTRSTDFITPKSVTSRRYRDAVLELAAENEFARPLLNSGRLSRPTPYLNSSLNTPDEDIFDSKLAPGTNCDDAPIRRNGENAWLLNELGDGFMVLTFGFSPGLKFIAQGTAKARVLVVGRDIDDQGGILSARYDARPGTTYLIRPDQYVAARWRQFDADKIKRALARAIGSSGR